ncbi:sensor histidine kinase [Ructibacterium gallinarum]|uniref:Histidine kinase n=1 Tax=Ructibacterium gallinarum TaxID=2779355 RepID=A0A9D5RAJ6_9FIRM|nr:sensor histidine kinase [Ructibacterium gallinarum]MBE5039163.1 histidine kinase [Ructibacterium gallinarum]
MRKKLFAKSSIKFKLICYHSFIVLSSLCIFVAIIVFRSNAVVKNLVQKNVDGVILNTQSNISTLISSINECMLTFQVNSEVQQLLSSDVSEKPIQDVATLEKELLSLDPFHTKIDSFELYSFKHDNYPRYNIKQSVFYSGSMQNDVLFSQMVNSGYETQWFIQDSITDGNSFIVASKLICGINAHEPVALLKAKVNLTTLTDIVDRLSLAETGKIFLCTQSHIANASESQLGQALKNNHVLFQDMLPSQTKQHTYIDIDNEKYYLCSYPIPETELYLVGAVKLSEFNSASDSLSSAIFYTGILVILFSMLFIAYISSMVTKPIMNMAKNMRHYDYYNNASLPANSHDEIGVLINSFNAMQNKITDLIQGIKRESKIRQIAELKALQAQITPHFLYNTLNSICALSHKYNAKDIEEMTMALSKFFVNSLNNGGEMLTLAREVEHAMSYVYIQKIRYGDKFNVEINLPENLKDYLICKLTLQPLIENCINHAFDCIDYTGEIKIDFRKEPNEKGSDDIVITVADNGLGEMVMDPNLLNDYINKEIDITEPIQKYGVHNVNQRIHLYFGKEYGLHYETGPSGGFTVTIRIKAILEKGEEE